MGKCSVCGRETPNTCSACDAVFYCDENCQTTDWFSTHRAECSLIAGKNKDRDQSPKRGPISPTVDVPPQQTFESFLQRVKTPRGTTTMETTLDKLEAGQNDPIVHVKLSSPCKSMEFFVQTLIGEGSFGKVFTACRGDADKCSNPQNFKLVVKFQILFEKQEKANFRSETKFGAIASEKGIGPELIYSCASPHFDQVFDDLLYLTEGEFTPWTKIGIQIFERWDMDLSQLIERGLLNKETEVGRDNMEFISRQLEAKRNQLHAEKIVHADLNPSNILVNVDASNRVTKLCLSDFGESFSFKERKDVEDWLERRREEYEGDAFGRYLRITTPLFELLDPAVLKFKQAIQKANLDGNWKPVEALFFADPTLLDRFIGVKNEDQDQSPKQAAPPPTTNVPRQRNWQTYEWYYDWLSQLRGSAAVETTLKKLKAGLKGSAAVESKEPIRHLNLSDSCDSIEVFVQTLIGSGGYGEVFTACLGTAEECSRPQNFRLVIKLQILEHPDEMKDFNSDVKFSQIASDENIGPHQFYACASTELDDLFNLLGTNKVRFRKGTKIGIQILERFDMDLYNFKQSRWLDEDTPLGRANRKFVLSELEAKRSRLHTLGIVHADLKLANILVDIDELMYVVKVCLADFGQSFKKIDAENWLEKFRYTTQNEHGLVYFTNLKPAFGAVKDQAVIAFKNAIQTALRTKKWEPVEAMFLKDPTLLDRFVF